MKKIGVFLAVLATASLSGCAHGNIRRVTSYNVPPPPKVAHPFYDPYAPYASSPAIWAPSVANEAGTLIKPNDPVDQGDRPDYEHAKWSVANQAKQAGTF